MGHCTAGGATAAAAKAAVRALPGVEPAQGVSREAAEANRLSLPVREAAAAGWQQPATQVGAEWPKVGAILVGIAAMAPRPRGSVRGGRHPPTPHPPTGAASSPQEKGVTTATTRAADSSRTQRRSTAKVRHTPRAATPQAQTVSPVIREKRPVLGWQPTIHSVRPARSTRTPQGQPAGQPAATPPATHAPTPPNVAVAVTVFFG